MSVTGGQAQGLAHDGEGELGDGDKAESGGTGGLATKESKPQAATTKLQRSAMIQTTLSMRSSHYKNRRWQIERRMIARAAELQKTSPSAWCGSVGVLLAASTIILLTAFPSFNANGLQGWLIAGGKYEEMCKDPDPICTPRKEALDEAANAAQFGIYMGGLATGLLFDSTGPRLTGMLGVAFFWFGFYLMCFTEYVKAGLICQGLCFQMIVNASMAVTSNFSEHRYLAVGVLGAAADLSLGVYPFLTTLSYHTSFGFEDISLIYLFAVLLCGGACCCVLPSETVSLAQWYHGSDEGKWKADQLKDDGGQHRKLSVSDDDDDEWSVLMSAHTNTRGHRGPTGAHHSGTMSEEGMPATDRTNALGVDDRAHTPGYMSRLCERCLKIPVMDHLLSPVFITFAIFFSILILQQNTYYISNKYILKEYGDTEGTFSEIFEFLLPFGFVFCLTQGFLIDAVGLSPVLIFINSIMMLVNILSLVPVLKVQLLTFLCFIAFADDIFQLLFCFTSFAFGYRRFGVIVGVLSLIAGLMAIINRVINQLIVEYLKCNFRVVHFIFIFLSIANFGPAYLLTRLLNPKAPQQPLVGR